MKVCFAYWRDSAGKVSLGFLPSSIGIHSPYCVIHTGLNRLSTRWLSRHFMSHGLSCLGIENKKPINKKVGYGTFFAVLKAV